MDKLIQKNEGSVEINCESNPVTSVNGSNDNLLEQINHFVDIIHFKRDIIFKNLAQIKRELETDIEYQKDNQEDLSLELKRKIIALEFVDVDSIENLFKNK
jgi:hypothetical protein